MNDVYKGRLKPDIRVSDGLSKIKSLGFFDELRFQVHRAAIDFATDIVVALLQADAFDFGALLDDHRAAFDFQIFNQDNRIAILQDRAVGIFDFQGIIACSRSIGLVPLMGALRANVLSAVFVSIFGVAFRAGR